MYSSIIYDDSPTLPFLGCSTISGYFQQQDGRSFDRHQLENLIPTIGGIPVTKLDVI